jgi:rod shape-determining protein MreD
LLLVLDNMKKTLTVLVFTLILLVFQTSVLPPFFPKGFFPQAAIMAVVGSTIIFGFNRALPWLITAGAILDMGNTGTIGPQIILFVLSAYAVSFFSKRFLVEHKAWSQAIIFFFILLVTILHRIYLLISYSVEGGVAGKAQFKWLLSAGIFTEIFANCVLLLLFYWIFKKSEKIFLSQ